MPFAVILMTDMALPYLVVTGDPFCITSIARTINLAEKQQKLFNQSRSKSRY